ncbi:MAG: hypothetical protein ABJN14_03070 [Paracoccaceae bacterium]
MPEQVYSVWYFYDCPRCGIADFNGEPHYFNCRFDRDVDEYSTIFDLKKIDEKTFETALELKAVFRDSTASFHSGEMSLQISPRHDGVLEKCNELVSRISDAPNTGQARAEFRPKQQSIPLLERPSDFEVVWS